MERTITSVSASRLVTYFAHLLLMASCANIVAPTGGERDMTAPVLKQKDFTDSMLNVHGRTWVMEFDEFVQIKESQNQLIITPLTTVKPKLTAHKKKVELTIPDSLLAPNTTYSIQFGKSIVDMHEGNAASIPDMTFSTGTYFDSLSLNGSVWEAETGAPDTGSVVMLYDATKSDSVIQKENPLYIQKTKGGLFSFQHLPSKKFRVFALGDKNNNLKYDGPAESLAFLNQEVDSRDTNQGIKLYVYREKQAFNDSLKVRNTPSKTRVTKPIPFSYSINVDTNNKTSRSVELTDTLSITFSFPFTKWEKGKIILRQKNIIDATAYIEADSNQGRIFIKTDWMEDMPYELELLEGFAMDSNKTMSKAGLYAFRTKRSSDYGTLTLKPVANENDWLLLFSENQMIRKTRISDTIVRFQLLKPGSYQLSILHDRNGNGYYDPGSFSEKRQPEIVERIPKEIIMKANWENTIDLRSDDRLKNIRTR